MQTVTHTATTLTAMATSETCTSVFHSIDIYFVFCLTAKMWLLCIQL